jgi:hypothetical protein
VGEYFYHEIIKRTVVGFGNLFNGLTIQKVDKKQNVINVMKVPLAYGPTQKFLAKITQQGELNQPTEITLPRMSFEMNSLAYDGSRKTAPTQMFKTLDNGETLKKVYLPVPYNIGFELNIMTKLNEDALQLVEQILPYFQPSFNITVDLVDQIGEKRDIPVVLDSINFTDDYEGDFTGRRILIYTLSFTAKSYMFGPVSESGDGLIRKVQVDYHTSTQRDSPREVRYTATPDPVDAEPDDDFGFSEETVVYFDSKVYSPTQGEDYTP